MKKRKGRVASGPQPKRTRRGFTLIELMIVVAIIAVIAAIAIPNLMQSKIASNEAMAVTSLKAYLSAQNMFHRSDHYRNAQLVYANPDATDGVSNGYPDLYQVGYQEGGGGSLIGEEIKLIDLSFADAHSDRGTKSKAGYHFDDLESEVGAPETYDYAIECGLVAAPFKYNRSGRNIFIIDVGGTVYQKDAGVELGSTTGGTCTPNTAYPSDLSTWIVTSNE